MKFSHVSKFLWQNLYRCFPGFTQQVSENVIPARGSCLPQSKLAEQPSKPAWPVAPLCWLTLATVLRRGFFQGSLSAMELMCIWELLDGTPGSRPPSCRTFSVLVYVTASRATQQPGVFWAWLAGDLFSKNRLKQWVLWITLWGKQA